MPTPSTQIDYRELIAQDVTGLSFERIHFDGNFSRSIFSGCAFLFCRLDRVRMAKTHWIDSRLDGSKLVIWFNDSVFERCSFRNASFYGLGRVYGGIRARFVGCDFTGATFKSVNLRACKFKSCDFSDARLLGCDLRGAVHDGKPLENAPSPIALRGPLTTSQIDEAILSAAETRWQKVAMITNKALERLGLHSCRKVMNLDLVLARIHALVSDGRLVAQGDTSKPRHSEVKLP